MLNTLSWTGSSLRLLDQTKLPTQTTYLDITDAQQTHDAIQRLVVRGAPAIGIAAAFGVYLGLRHSAADSLQDFDSELNTVCSYLATSRPTAVNLFHALDRQKQVSLETRKQGSRTPEQMVQKIIQRLLAEALTMLDEDAAMCRAIGQHALPLLPTFPDRPTRILTHCNAGALATAGIGTALAPLYLAHDRGIQLQIFADETRPLLQGARITAFELHAANIPVTVLCDNMAATLLSQNQIDAILVGADRIASNGDTANKIGTLPLAICAKYYNVPFYVLAPTSTLDPSLPTGSQIPIEQRHPKEISHSFNHPLTPEGVQIFNPAFDITPANLITAIITEQGVAHPPYTNSLKNPAPQADRSL